MPYRNNAKIFGWIGSVARLVSGYTASDFGNVATLFAFLSIPMLMIGGAAIDYGFATRLETKLQAATDSIVLLLCQTPLNTTADNLNTMAQQAMNGAMGGQGLVVDPLTITQNPRQITLKAHKLSTVFFGKLTGTNVINPVATAQCATPMPKVFEIALVLDNTGSMNKAGDDGVTKIASLRSAAKNFISYIFNNPSFASGTKISIVPFAASVAVSPSTYMRRNWVDTQGLSKYHWSNVVGAASAGFNSRFDIFAKLSNQFQSWSWAGCFESLPYPQNVTDTGVSGNDSLYIPYFAPDEGGSGTVAPGYFDANKTYVGTNSYLDDYTNDPRCAYQQPQGNSTSYMTAMGRACKYAKPQNAKSGTYIAELGPNGPNFGCTSQPLQLLTNSSSTLYNIVDNMTAGGVTNIHEGFMWGWRTLSPYSVLYDGTASAYGSATVNKIIILMTDGTNTWLDWGASPNKSLFSSNGFFMNVDKTDPDAHFPAANQNITTGSQARAGLDALTRLACSNAGTANVAIYTIGLSVSSDPIDNEGISLLQDCARYGNGLYFQANNSDTLIAAFSKIAKSIGSLRITR